MREPPKVALDCPFIAWAFEEIDEAEDSISIDDEDLQEQSFTFSHVPPDLVGGDKVVILRPSSGVQ